MIIQVGNADKGHVGVALSAQLFIRGNNDPRVGHTHITLSTTSATQLFVFCVFVFFFLHKYCTLYMLYVPFIQFENIRIKNLYPTE